MLLKKYIGIFKNALNIKTISVLVRYANIVNYEKARVGNNIENTKVRNVSTFNFTTNDKSLTNCHWAYYLNYKFTHFMNEYLQKQDFAKNIGFMEGCNQIDLLKYEKDNFYDYHVDDGKHTNRILSCILFLNNDYEGGELCFKNTFDDEEVAVKPLPGKLIIWPSNIMFPHTVKPVKKGIRYTVVGWAR
jgi:predicted 2-oxoglutarate/Fe(II)-dependent dioxygenase YbiX